MIAASLADVVQIVGFIIASIGFVILDFLVLRRQLAGFYNKIETGVFMTFHPNWVVGVLTALKEIFPSDTAQFSIDVLTLNKRLYNAVLARLTDLQRRFAAENLLRESTPQQLTLFPTADDYLQQTMVRVSDIHNQVHEAIGQHLRTRVWARLTGVLLIWILILAIKT